MPLYTDSSYLQHSSPLFSPYYSASTSSGVPYGVYSSAYNRSNYVIPLTANHQRTSPSYNNYNALGSRYQPKLSTITENSPLATSGLHKNFMPLSRIHSPKYNLYSLQNSKLSTTKYKPPRPILINTADIDVSYNRFCKRLEKDTVQYGEGNTTSKQPRTYSPRQHEATSNVTSNVSAVQAEPPAQTSESIKQRSTIKRNRTVIRLSTIRAPNKSNKQPFENESISRMKSTTQESAVNEEQKTGDYKTHSDYNIPEATKTSNTEASAEQLSECLHTTYDETTSTKLVDIESLPTFHDICEDISSDKINDDLNAGELRRRASSICHQDIELLNQMLTYPSATIVENSGQPNDEIAKNPKFSSQLPLKADKPLVQTPKDDTKNISQTKVLNSTTSKETNKNNTHKSKIHTKCKEQTSTEKSKSNIEKLDFVDSQAKRKFGKTKSRIDDKESLRISSTDKAEVAKKNSEPGSKIKLKVNEKTPEKKEISNISLLNQKKNKEGTPKQITPLTITENIKPIETVSYEKPLNSTKTSNLKLPQNICLDDRTSVNNQDTLSNQLKLNSKTLSNEVKSSYLEATPKPIKKTSKQSAGNDVDFWAQIGTRETLYMTNRKKILQDNNKQLNSTDEIEVIKPIRQQEEKTESLKVTSKPSATTATSKPFNLNASNTDDISKQSVFQPHPKNDQNDLKTMTSKPKEANNKAEKFKKSSTTNVQTIEINKNVKNNKFTGKPSFESKENNSELEQLPKCDDTIITKQTTAMNYNLQNSKIEHSDIKKGSFGKIAKVEKLEKKLPNASEQVSSIQQQPMNDSRMNKGEISNETNDTSLKSNKKSIPNDLPSNCIKLPSLNENKNSNNTNCNILHNQTTQKSQKNSSTSEFIVTTAVTTVTTTTTAVSDAKKTTNKVGKSNNEDERNVQQNQSVNSRQSVSPVRLTSLATVSNLAQYLQYDVDDSADCMPWPEEFRKVADRSDRSDRSDRRDDYGNRIDRSDCDISSADGCEKFEASMRNRIKKQRKPQSKKQDNDRVIPNINSYQPFANVKQKLFVKAEAAPRYQLVATPRPLWRCGKPAYSDSDSTDSSDSNNDDDDEETSGSIDESNEDELHRSFGSNSHKEIPAMTRLSTSSNDSGFEGGTAPSTPKKILECDVHCHKKCERLTANLCGVNQKLIAEALASVKRETSYTYTQFQKHGRITKPATVIPKFKNYSIDDFHFLAVLGKGSFGKVLLAELRETTYNYAVKCLRKDVVLEDDDVESTLIERKVLALGTKHPYLCHLFCTFQTESHLFFVMEYLNGGDLMFHIQETGRFTEERARFYGAEIISGLKYLHNKGIIYRDLKLDNVLLDCEGHIRIADFGMCKLQIYLDKTADTFCGTPDYMAPEVIKGEQYNQNVDWWSFGVLLYEMLIGQSPFSGCDEDELFWSICNEIPWFPVYISTEATSILKALLEKDQNRRIGGSQYNPAGNICEHSFFKPIDWQLLEKRLVQPPFQPQVKHPLDTQYFDRVFTRELVRLTPIDKEILQSIDQQQFSGFTYTNPYITLD